MSLTTIIRIPLKTTYTELEGLVVRTLRVHRTHSLHRRTSNKPRTWLPFSMKQIRYVVYDQNFFWWSFQFGMPLPSTFSALHECFWKEDYILGNMPSVSTLCCLDSILKFPDNFQINQIFRFTAGDFVNIIDFLFQFVNPKLFEIATKLGFGGNKGQRYGYGKFSRGGQTGGARQHTRFGNIHGGGFKAGMKSG